MVYLSYLSGIMGNQRLSIFITQELYRDYTTPKRLKVTYSTTRLLEAGDTRTHVSQRIYRNTADGQNPA